MADIPDIIHIIGELSKPMFKYRMASGMLTSPDKERAAEARKKYESAQQEIEIILIRWFTRRYRTDITEWRKSLG